MEIVTVDMAAVEGRKSTVAESDTMNQKGRMIRAANEGIKSLTTRIGLLGGSPRLSLFFLPWSG